MKTLTPVSSFLRSSFSKSLMYRSIRSGSSIRSSCIIPLTLLYFRINRDIEILLFATRSHLSAVCRIRQSLTTGQERVLSSAILPLEDTQDADLRISFWHVRKAV